VTSGSGLTEDRLRRLIDEGLDFIGFSIAGVTPGTHNAIRVNSDLADLVRAIGWATGISKRQPGRRPRVHVIFLMLKHNVAEMPDVPQFAAEVVVLNIVQVTDEAQEAQRVFACDGRESPYEDLLRETEENARKLGVKITHPSLVPSEVAVCDENPLRNLYISSSGEVSPCVYLYPPVLSPFPRIFCGREYATEKITFGNVFTQPFDAIWGNPSYAAFRERFTRRKQAFERAYGALLSGSRPEMAEPLPDPPEPCKTCHKMMGF
jgi:MoaA/NifB/PqqE/SkfB family radical SAM enzyme